MWGLSEYKADLEQINNANYTNLNVFSKVQPGDEELLHRYHFIKVLSFFKRNDFTELTNHSNMYLDSIYEYMDKWNEEYLDPGFPAPPFDFMLLVMMTSTNGDDTFNKFMRLFRHYSKVLAYLKTQNQQRQILLTDKTKTDEFYMTVGNAVLVVHGRLNYIAENIVAILHSTRKYSIITSFLNEFMPPDQVNDDETLSCFGRVLISIGDRSLADKYFEKVLNPALKTINKGYYQFFDGNFAEAAKSLTGNLAPSNEACNYYMGDFKTDISENSNSSATPKKPTPESLTRWPLPPLQA
ncbi:hypothetical protein TVAG_178700 [Trichomonas vaginalis G3]|uniref:Uncharacterized protein n=1 Tax=Trichomonas vaginalis (strain ATCC PRA-98 / G3) TaxID=412133 RepID=A2DIM2_TRIV3|nr:hypothetical protein TVAGG3_0602790 [Trichomonas vaginalis G3]EAY19826.1 hypothetical protein TVAG_178700 [Trichomonas vaginalis G3]KAI5524029.1 hypothetical protein TVAGG3_0602790 [Trichomonas vaginalis G3]|eukprot:XP_001580812.1 hypothetical protein [Trichomonas vaginalis G3]